MVSKWNDKKDGLLSVRRINLSRTFPFLLSPSFLRAISQWISVGHFGFTQEGVRV